jgi:hypothetical protein
VPTDPIADEGRIQPVVRQNSSQMRFRALTVFSSDNVTDVTQLG